MKRILFYLAFLFVCYSYGQNSIVYYANGKLPADYTVNNIFTVNDANIWFAASKTDGNGPVIVGHTENGGIDWSTFKVDAAVNGYSLDFMVLDDNNVYTSIEDNLSGDVYWYKSNNKGLSWYKLALSNYANFIHMYNANEGVLLGGGAGYYTDDSFKTTKELGWKDVGGPPKLFGYNFLSGTNAKCKNDSGEFFIYPKGNIVRTKDKGRSWQGYEIGENNLISSSSITCINNQLLVLQRYQSPNNQRLAFSLNNGKTWESKTQNIPSACTRINALESIPQASSFLFCDFNEGVYVTKDSAKSWEKVSFTGSIPNYSGAIKMSSTNNLWIGLNTANSSSPSIAKLSFEKTSKLDKTSFIQQIKIFPNPANNKVNINAPIGSNFKLYDYLGNVLYSNCVMHDNEAFDLTQINSGIYFVQFELNGNMVLEKLVKL